MMKQHVIKFVVAVAAATTIAQSSLAEERSQETAASLSANTIGAAVGDYDALAQAFDGFELAGATLLDEPTMRDTRGELWPFIVSVVGLDLALSSYFWGVYVPTVGGGSGCITCSYALTSAQH